jgi:hypothetical protein
MDRGDKAWLAFFIVGGIAIFAWVVRGLWLLQLWWIERLVDVGSPVLGEAKDAGSGS